MTRKIVTGAEMEAFFLLRDAGRINDPNELLIVKETLMEGISKASDYIIDLADRIRKGREEIKDA